MIGGCEERISIYDTIATLNILASAVSPHMRVCEIVGSCLEEYDLIGSTLSTYNVTNLIEEVFARRRYLFLGYPIELYTDIAYGNVVNTLDTNVQRALEFSLLSSLVFCSRQRIKLRSADIIANVH